jgi:hypothetical protein
MKKPKQTIIKLGDTLQTYSYDRVIVLDCFVSSITMARAFRVKTLPMSQAGASFLIGEEEIEK